MADCRSILSPPPLNFVHHYALTFSCLPAQNSANCIGFNNFFFASNSLTCGQQGPLGDHTGFIKGDSGMTEYHITLHYSTIQWATAASLSEWNITILVMKRSSFFPASHLAQKVKCYVVSPTYHVAQSGLIWVTNLQSAVCNCLEAVNTKPPLITVNSATGQQNEIDHQA